MSIRLLVTYDANAISAEMSSLFQNDPDIELVGVVDNRQLNAQVLDGLQPHLLVVGHMTYRHVSGVAPKVKRMGLMNNDLSNHFAGKTELGNREGQVLQMVAVGCTSKEIAKNLDISPNTVDVHRRNIMRKLGLHKAADLTRFAIKHQMICIDE